MFRELAGASPATISAIAIVATLNTVLAQLTVASRVVSGLRESRLPWFFEVNPRAGTPVLATPWFIADVIGADGAADAPGGDHVAGHLSVFAVVNLALLRLRYLGAESPAPHVTVPVWVPAIGVATCTAMIAQALLP